MALQRLKGQGLMWLDGFGRRVGVIWVAGGSRPVSCGMPMAAGLAGRRPGGAGVEGARRERLPAGRGAAGGAARGAGGRPGGARLGPGPAVDPGASRGPGRTAVRRGVHAARDVVPAAPPRLYPAGPGSPGRGAGRGRRRRMAGGDLGEGTRLAAATGAWVCFEDEAGQALKPAKARTRAPRGRTPVARVSGNSGRLSVAGMACLKPGRPGRFFYRVHVHRRRKGSRPSLGEADYAALIAAAHRTLGAPVILIWDNHGTHRSKKMRAFTEAHADWLTVIHLPGYARDLNAVEGAWANMKSS